MGKNQLNEKEEKDLKKREEKSAEEKWERDPLGAIVWAAILIWAGIVLLAANLGFLNWMNDVLEWLPDFVYNQTVDIDIVPGEGWTLFFVGGAAILLAEVIIRLLFPGYRKPVLGTIILAAVFLGLGLGSWNCIWPFVLIGLGVSILVRGRRNKKE